MKHDNGRNKIDFDKYIEIDKEEKEGFAKQVLKSLGVSDMQQASFEVEMKLDEISDQRNRIDDLITEKNFYKDLLKELVYER